MEVDGGQAGDEHDRLLVRDAAYQVVQRKTLPEEVKQVVAVAGKSLPGPTIAAVARACC